MDDIVYVEESTTRGCDTRAGIYSRGIFSLISDRTPSNPGNENSLEDTLRKLKELKRDLTAEIVISPAKFEYQTVVTDSWDGKGDGSFGRPDLETLDSPVEVEPAITKPDTQKRDLARAQLQQIYKTHKLKIARYVAGKVLGVDFENLRKEFGYFLMLKVAWHKYDQ